MKKYNTHNPVGSADPRDLYDNASCFDDAVNCESATWTDRFGKTRVSLARLDQIVASLDSAGFTFATVADGLAGTADGQYFRVPQGAEGDYAFFYYQNKSGNAINVAKLIGNRFVESRLPDVASPNFKIPLFVDEAGNVPVWLENGKLNAAGISDNLRDVIDTSYPEKIPLFYDENGNVPLWLENGKLGAVELSDRLKETVDSGITEKIPLFVDEAGNVPLWLENGKLNAVDLHDKLKSNLLDGAILDEKLLSKKIASDGRTLWKYRAKIANLNTGNSCKIKIGFTGDSWTEHNTIPQTFADYFYSKYGKSGDGWIQLNIDNPNQLNEIELTRTGWSVYDASTTSANPEYPTAMDGQYIFATGTDAELQLKNVYSSIVKIFYYDGDGAFRYSINSGTAITVAGAGTNKIVSHDITGIDVSSATNLKIDLMGNEGTVVIYGFYSDGVGNGVEIDKMGNGGITAPQYTKILPYISQTGLAVEPDVLIMIIGTNDYRTSVPLSAFRDGLLRWIGEWKKIIPDSGIILITPPQCNAAGVNPLSGLRDIMREVAVELGVEYYSMYDDLSVAYSKSNALNLWKDNLHLSRAGAQLLLNQLNKFLLG